MGKRSTASGKEEPVLVDRSCKHKPGLLSMLFFFFVDPIIKQGHRTTLQTTDLYKPDVVHIDKVHGKFDAAWQRQLKFGKPDIRRAVIANSIGGLIYTGLLYCLSLAAQLVGPMMLNRIVGGLQCWSRTGHQGGVCPTQQDLYYFIIAISLAPVIQSLAENQMQFHLNIVGLKMRNGLMAGIYRKCLRLSNSALQSESTGKVVTLMSNDAQKVQDVMLAIHTLWGAPALIIVILVLLYQQVGWATFVGFGVAVIYSPISTKVSARLIVLRRSLMTWTDKRVGLMNEIVNSIQMIKFYAWESSFKAAVMEVRDKEAGILKRMVWVQSIFVMLLFSGPVMMAVAVFAVYAVTGHTFGAANAYTALALFNLLRLPLAFLPMMVTMLINALVALNRIGDFLMKPESGMAALRQAAEGTPPGHVKVDGGDFTWEAGSTEASLSHVNFTAAPGSLTMIVGSVGSGKSSVLAALIGQMERVRGTVAVGGRVAYVAQTAWIINDSVQENIIMGEAFDPLRYRVAVDVSQLLPDLDILPNGDATEIGDRGVTLSGGQKQRISIARAVYSDADVYLMDDPLSAVDSHVGRALFERCIRGVLVGKTVILVTNALQYLPYADNVLWMENGTIRAQGRYQQLVDVGLNIAELVHLEGEEEEDGSDNNSDIDGTEHWEPAAGPSTDSNSSRQSVDSVKDSASSPVGSSAVPAVLARGSDTRPSGETSPATSSSSPRAYVNPAHVGHGVAAVAAADRLRRPASANSMHALQGGSSTPGSSVNGTVEVVHAARHKSNSSGGGMKKSKSLAHLPESDFASAGSVLGASLRLASQGGPAPRSLSMVRLAAEANRNLTGVEAREQGSISGAVLKSYINAGGGWLIVAFIVLMFALEQGSRVFTDTWLGFWASNNFQQSMWFYSGIYAASGVLYSLMTFARTLRFMYTTVNAAVEMHNRLLQHMLRLPKSFFDTNPAGRILNRFSRDVETMDSVLNQSMVQFANCFASYLAILVVISVATRWFGIAIVPITIIYVVLQRYYIPGARELQRIESVTRSPIYSKFSEALAGVATIRAYRREEYFTAASDALMELNAYAFVTQRAASAWLAMRLDFLGLVILTVAAVLCIRGSISPGLAGLCLVYALDLTRFLKHGTAMASKTESDFNSVERVVQYLQPPTEAPEDTDPALLAEMPKDWPSAGAIAVRDLKLRYRPGLPLVLHGVSFDVSPGEKVGLVGRTGSGKSSLLLALFRMVEADSGSISIDGVNIRHVGLKQLRSQMSIIPQDPFMFSGTVRSNLDPFQAYTEHDLWRVLEAVGLKDTITALQLGLDAPVVDGGNNFSQGQKQLFCMARAMLRNSRVLMLDEATASVDPETDRLIQLAIRSVFVNTTMLTIAHRLNTIMDADRVLVLDQGLLVENGEPHELLQKQSGIFVGMVEQTGASSSQYLREVAHEASFTRAKARAASVTAQALHAQRVRQDDSVIIGQQYVKQPVTAAGVSCDYAGDSSGAAGDEMTRVRSDVGMSKYTVQDPMSVYMATGTGFARELSLLQHNAAAAPDSLAAAVARRLSSDTSQLSAVLEQQGGGAINSPRSPNNASRK